MKDKLHTVLFTLFLIVVSIPMCLTIISYEAEPLEGAFEEEKREGFSFSSVYEGTYQVQLEKEEKSLNPIVPTMIRLRNQVDYSAFSEGHMADALLGKDGYVFGEGWSNAYVGNRIYDDVYFDTIVAKLKLLQEIYDSDGKAFLVLIPPCKEELFPEKLPFGFVKKGKNDYESYLEALEKYDVEYMDFKEYYQSVMDTSSFPVYSKTSAHWTMYGAYLALNQVVNSIEQKLGVNLIDYRVKSFNQTKYDRGDGDQEGPLNLLFTIDNSLFAYPSYEFDSTETFYKPKVTIIGDSFYWGINNSYVPFRIYSKESKYLYYYSTCYANSDAPSVSVKDLNIIEEFESSDVIILITGSHNLNGFPFGLEKDLDRLIEGLKAKENTVHLTTDNF